MPFSAGPNIAARPNLVFEYDTGDVQNSYKGEPTTNLAPYSQDFSQWGGNLFSNWINSNVTLNNGYAPDGTFTANTFGNGYSRFTNSIAASTNTIYTFSVWLQNVSLTGAGVQLWYAFGLNGGLVSYANGLSVGIGTLTNQWQRFQFSVTSPSSGINQLQFGVAPFTGYGNNNSGQLVNVWGGQVEQKNHATQYLPTTTTTATRSNTQGLLDVSGYNRTMSLANVSFNSSAQITFDGTDDYIYAILFPSAPSVMSAEFVFYKTTSSNTDLSYQGFAPRFALRSNQINLYHATAGQTGDVNFACTINTNTYYHVVLTFDAVNKYQCYLNTVSLSRSYNGDAANGVPGFTETYIGYQAGSEGYFAGSIPICRYYDYALSAQEVRRNYNQLKGRFNLP